MIDIEELLADHLSQVAARAVPRHDLDAVMGEQTVVVLRRTTRPLASPRWLTRFAVGAAAVGVVTVAVIALRSDSQLPTAVDPQASASPTCQVFVRPDASAEVIAGIGERLRQRPEVIDLQLVSQQQAYEEFLRIFAGKDITRSVTADMLPSKWIFDLDPDTAANQQATTAELGRDPAVKQAECTQSTSPATGSKCDDSRPTMVTAPDVTGEHLRDAITIMRDAGLTVISSGVPDGDPVDANAIVRVQVPPAGLQVPLGTCVGFRTRH
jgi:hypothetical protein